MRKKLSLFLVMLMALTMVLGTGITVMAAEPPEGAPLSVRSCTQQTTGVLWYVTRIEGDKVYVLIYNIDGSYIGSAQASVGAFLDSDSISVGRVYHSIAGGRYCFCDDNLPLAECGNNEYQYLSHFYSYGKLNSDGDEVFGAYYYRAGELWTHNDNTSFAVSSFDGGNFGEGWYYSDGFHWVRCSGPHSITPVNPYNSNPDPDPDPTPDPDPDPTPDPDPDPTPDPDPDPTPEPNPEPQEYYLDRLNRMLEEAIASGSTATIYWNEGDSIPNYIMKLLYENPKLSFDFKYTFKGVEHEIFIGPGQATNDDINWYGPSWLLKKYGEKKVLPASHGSHGSYIIAEGDTLNKLAKRFNTTIDNLLKLNPDIVDRNRIYAGNRIYY